MADFGGWREQVVSRARQVTEELARVADKRQSDPTYWSVVTRVLQAYAAVGPIGAATEPLLAVTPVVEIWNLLQPGSDKGKAYAFANQYLSKRVPAASADLLSVGLVETVELVSAAEQRPLWRRWGRLWNWLTAAQPQQAWIAIHRAEEALLLVARDDYVVSQSVALQRKWNEVGGDKNDGTAASYMAFLNHFVPADGSRPQRAVTPPEREQLRAITYAVHDQSEVADENLHSYRNQLMAVGGFLVLGVVVTVALSRLFPGSLDLCTAGAHPVCLSGTDKATPWDVLFAVVAGGLGGLVSAVYVFRSLQSYRNPYAIQLVQALIKVPFGAVVGFWLTLMVERGVFGLFQPQPGPQALGVAFLFGFAQQAVSRSLDQKAQTLLGQVKAASPMTPKQHAASESTGAEASPAPA